MKKLKLAVGEIGAVAADSEPTNNVAVILTHTENYNIILMLSISHRPSYVGSQVINLCYILYNNSLTV